MQNQKELLKTNNNPKKDFYKKIIIIVACFLFQTIPYGIAINTQPLFVSSVSSILFGGAKNQFLFTLMFTIGALSSAFISPLIGKRYGKVNVKWLFLTGSFLSGGSLALQGLSQFAVGNVAGAASILYIFRISVELGTVMFSSLGLPFLISAWFPGKGRGIALGIAFAGGSFGNIAIWQPLTNWLINDNVLKNVLNIYFMYGGISILVAVILTLTFVKLPGSSINKKQSQTNLIQYRTIEEEIEANGPGVRYVIRNPNFWIMSISYGIAGFGCCAFSGQYGAFMRDGLNAVQVLTFVGMGWGIGCLIGNVMGGFIFEHLGINIGILFANSTRIIATIFILLGAINPWMVMVAAIIFGFSVFLYTSGSGFITHTLFGKKEAAVTMSIMSLCFSIGYSIGQPSMSLIKATSDFSYAFGAKMNGN